MQTTTITAGAPDVGAPGITVREVEAPAPPPATASVTGFVGQAERGPLDSPQPLDNWGQYRDVFGGLVGHAYLPYAVFGFFANGGRRCWVVRVAADGARAARRQLAGVAVEALDPGAWGNQVEVTAETGRRGLRLAFRRRGGDRREEVFDELALDPAHPRYFVRVVNGDPPAASYVERIVRGHSLLARVNDLGAAALDPFPAQGPLALDDGDDGDPDLGAGALRILTGYADGVLARPPGGRPAAGDEPPLVGLAALEAVPEVGLVAVPDLLLPDLWAATPAADVPAEGIVFLPAPPPGLDPVTLAAGGRELLAHCRRTGGRFALLDAPWGAADPGAWAESFRPLPEARDGALYFPWIRPRAADFEGRAPWLPPSGHTAGIYARSEEQAGVGKAPANALLRGVVDLELCVDDARQAELNPLGVNCLRALPGRGLRVWGARTLAADPQWRYVNVRRVALAVVRQILLRLRWTVFEPGGPALWRDVTAALTLYLRRLFEVGALAGATAAEAFFVKCDAETNPPAVVAAGQMVALVGFAPARPAEYVVVTLKRTGTSLTASERSP